MKQKEQRELRTCNFDDRDLTDQIFRITSVLSVLILEEKSRAKHSDIQSQSKPHIKIVRGAYRRLHLHAKYRRSDERTNYASSLNRRARDSSGRNRKLHL